MIESQKGNGETLKRLIAAARTALDMLETTEMVPFEPGERERFESQCGHFDFIIAPFGVTDLSRINAENKIYARRN